MNPTDYSDDFDYLDDVFRPELVSDGYLDTAIPALEAKIAELNRDLSALVSEKLRRAMQ